MLDGDTRQYRYLTHYTTDAFSTDRPWPLTVDLPGLTERRAVLLRHAAGR